MSGSSEERVITTLAKRWGAPGVFSVLLGLGGYNVKGVMEQQAATLKEIKTEVRALREENAASNVFSAALMKDVEHNTGGWQENKEAIEKLEDKVDRLHRRR